MGGSKYIRIWVGLGFFLALIAMGLLGLEAYRSVEQLAYNLEAASTPNEELRQVNEISNTLTLMESSVQAFTITGNPDLLQAYYQGAGRLSKQVKSLRKLAKNKPQTRKILSLVSEKTKVLNDLVATSDDGSAAKAYDRYVNSQEELPSEVKRPSTYSDTIRVSVVDSVVVRTATKDKSVVEAEKRSFFQALFGSKKKNATKQVPAPQPPAKAERRMSRSVAVDTLAGKVTEAVDPAKKPLEAPRLHVDSFQFQAEKTAQMRVDTVLALATKDSKLSQQILSQIRILESLRQADSKGLSDASSERAARTIRFIGIFGVIVVLIFSVLLAVIFYDIRRNQQLQTHLREEKLKTDELSRVKEAFLTSISHDLRTPMHALIGFSEQLGKTPLTHKQAWFHRHIQQASAYLMALLNDVLDYAKMQSPGFTFEQIPFSPESVAREAAALFQQKIQEKRLTWDLTLAENLPQVVIGDPLRLRQVLFNLLSNAVKFTEQGTIGLHLTVESASEEDVVLRFTVADTGIGVPSEKLERIFAAFGQADASTSRRYGGTGLGLSITRQLTEMQEGSLFFDSEPGAGTRVSCLLPYVMGKASDLPDTSTKAETGNLYALQGKKALIADDESFNRSLLSEILTNRNIEVIGVENGREALAEVESQSFDFILLDLHMPEMDGVTATRAIRKHTDVPIIGLTAAIRAEEELEAKEAGMNELLLKPFKENDLLQMLLAEIDPDSHNFSLPIFHEKPMQGKYASLFQSGGPDFVNKMLSIFVQNGRKYLSEMDDAARIGAHKMLGEIAHKWLPSCRHLGLKQEESLLAAIEHEALHGNTPALATDQYLQARHILERALHEVRMDLVSDSRLANVSKGE